MRNKKSPFIILLAAVVVIICLMLLYNDGKGESSDSKSVSVTAKTGSETEETQLAIKSVTEETESVMEATPLTNAEQQDQGDTTVNSTDEEENTMDIETNEIVQPQKSDKITYVTGDVELTDETAANADLYPALERTLTYSTIRIMVGDDVKYIQSALIEMNYTGLVVNGYYDADTVSAVKRFQKNHGYTQDGKVDSTMYNAIKSALSVWRNKSVESPKNVDFYPVPERSLKYDSNNIMTGEDVKYVQAALIEMNYDGIAVTGKYDASTAEAVKRFQTNHNLYVDGIVGKETSAALVKYLNAWRNR